MRNRFSWAGALALLAAALLSSCSDEATEQNTLVSSLPTQDVVVRETTLVAERTSTYKQVEPMDGAWNLAGIAEHVTASLLLQFAPGGFPARDTAVVYSARLTLRPVYSFGQQPGSFAFTVHRIDRLWNPSMFSADSLQAGFYDPLVRGSYGGVAADTLPITIDLDTAMVREWLRTATSATTTKYGIILVPTPISTGIRGFYSFNADSLSRRPTLEIIAGSPTGPQRDTSRYSAGYDTFVATAQEPLSPDPTILSVRGGIVYRSSLWFNTSQLPRYAIVNNATMTLTRRAETSLAGRPAADPDYAVHLRRGADSSFQPIGGIQAVKTAETVYTFDMREMTQSWLRGSNYGVVLRAGNTTEFSTVDLATFYNQNAADPAVRPRLRIIYSTPK